MNLLRVLQSERVSTEVDKVTWIGLASDSFSVRATYKVLHPRVASSFPAKGIWASSGPTKSAFFLRGKPLGKGSYT